MYVGDDICDAKVCNNGTNKVILKHANHVLRIHKKFLKLQHKYLHRLYCVIRLGYGCQLNSPAPASLELRDISYDYHANDFLC